MRGNRKHLREFGVIEMTKYIRKEVEIEVDIDFDDILDEYGNEITEFIRDKILLQKTKTKNF